MRKLLNLLFVCLFFNVAIHAQIKVISWNVHMIPVSSMKNARAIKINNFLRNENADIILLQECFSKKIIRKISSGYKYVIKPKRKLFKLNSGLLILSNQPLYNYQYHNFKSKKGIDALCNKGAISFEIYNDSLSSMIKIVNTHLQNNFTHITIAQVDELKTFSDGSDIIGGDFNCKDIEMLKKSLSMNYNITGPTFKTETIDFIFTNIDSYGYAIKSDLSDHNPIITFVKIKKFSQKNYKNL